MKQLLLIISILTISIIKSSSQQYSELDSLFIDTTQTDWYFAVSLMQTVRGDLMHYAVIKKQRNGKWYAIYMTKTDFLLQITGQQDSKANPNHINYMKEYRIYWQTLDEMWKLRYAEYPYRKKYDDNEPGWAKRKFMPSEQQLEYLRKNYGIKYITDFIYGKNLFKLLVNMQDPNWVEYYKSL
jgi:hypothetical protein